MMAHAMGTSHRLWDPQVPALAGPVPACFGTTGGGHGDTDAPPGPYRLDQFVEDAVGLMDALDLKRVHWVGISTGGMIGQGLGIHRPGTGRVPHPLQHDFVGNPLVSGMGEGTTGGRAPRGNGSGLGDDEAALVHRRPSSTRRAPGITRCARPSSVLRSRDISEAPRRSPSSPGARTCNGSGHPPGSSRRATIR